MTATNKYSNLNDWLWRIALTVYGIAGGVLGYLLFNRPEAVIAGYGIGWIMILLIFRKVEYVN